MNLQRALNVANEEIKFLCDRMHSTMSIFAEMGKDMIKRDEGMIEKEDEIEKLHHHLEEIKEVRRHLEDEVEGLCRHVGDQATEIRMLCRDLDACRTNCSSKTDDIEKLLDKFNAKEVELRTLRDKINAVPPRLVNTV